MKDMLNSQIWDRNVLKYSQDEDEISELKKQGKYAIPKMHEMGTLTDKNLHEEDVWRLRDVNYSDID
jgi:hypothetical protein